MEKPQRWQRYLIIFVALLVLLNILPTVFYYTKPLRDPVETPRAEVVTNTIVNRVKSLEKDSVDWLWTMTKHLNLRPLSIDLNKENPSQIIITFNSLQEAEIFRATLPRAGVLIPFIPAQLTLGAENTQNPNSVIVQRKVNSQLGTDPKAFTFLEKFDAEGAPTEAYKAIIEDRVAFLLNELVGDSVTARQLEAITASSNDSRLDDLTLDIARRISNTHATFGPRHPLTTRFFASFTYSNAENVDRLIDLYVARLDSLKQRLQTQISVLQQQQQVAEESGTFLEPSQQTALQTLTNNFATIEDATNIISQQSSTFRAGLASKPLSKQEIINLLKNGEIDSSSGIQEIAFGESHPLFRGASLDWTDDLLTLHLHDNLETLREQEAISSEEVYLKERLNQILINEIARISRETDEKIAPQVSDFTVKLSTLTNSESLLTLDLGRIAESYGDNLVSQLKNDWAPIHPDLTPGVYPINNWAEYKTLSPSDQRLGLVVYSPAMEEGTPPTGFRTGSLYVIARGMDSILEKYKGQTQTADNQQFIADFQHLAQILGTQGFVAHSGKAYGFDSDYSRDYIFELPDYYATILSATRENFQVHGSKKLATLEFSDIEQRILVENKIDDTAHEELLKWKEEYQKAQVSMDPSVRRNTPPPTKNSYWQNLVLSAKKYFRGDDRKILRWGLDLSGGKTVRIGLQNQNGEVVTDPEQLKQAVNELYNRINKMGVAERSIRIENNNIILEFPGSQALSASDLVKASAMHFHIVNEKFGLGNPVLGQEVNNFLAEVWEEGVVTNRTDPESLHTIAWEHLGGDEEGAGMPRSEAARTLYENGLRLANPRALQSSSTFDDRISRVTRFRGDDRGDWQGQAHPLMIIMNNFALEGSSLTNVMAAYDSKSGNLLQFSVSRSYKSRSGSPRDDLHTWTSQYSQDKITGTPKEQITGGRGWRLAVILNEEVISAPELLASLRDGGSITGRFTQREINQLVADLKAGSLSFTPKILSEHNISPELGAAERQRGIIAALIGFALVVICMITIYRFAGVIASLALIFNLLMIWAVLQNIGAALSLPGIAAIVLTMGMAVDANVLVFERTREEFKRSGRLASALHAGYSKAFSAIIDSNLTTVIAALILIQFDSGPIKGFAITLIIGIVASMFSALFLTRYFFASWIQKDRNRKLPMMEFLTKTNINWLSMARPAMILSAAIITIGSFYLIAQRNTLFGMDFTGGYAISFDVEERGDQNYRRQAEEALIAAGASVTDLQVQELSRNNQLRIQLGISMEEVGRPFYGMPAELKESSGEYAWQNNPRLAWVVAALEKGGVQIQEVQLVELDKNWTSMSGQFSDAMRYNAMLALSAALLSILLYITFRFEFKYALAAVIGLAHDVIVSLGILALMHKIGMPVQIDLQVVGAIMTIIGYSLNDTIIVFDRVREDLELYRKLSFAEIVNQALNTTLSRTIMTSLTTLLVLLSLVFLGGSTIFTFSVVMTIGVLIGTLSTLFIASPVLVYINQREEHQLQQVANMKMV